MVYAPRYLQYDSVRKVGVLNGNGELTVREWCRENSRCLQRG